MAWADAIRSVQRRPLAGMDLVIGETIESLQRGLRGRHFDLGYKRGSRAWRRERMWTYRSLVGLIRLVRAMRQHAAGVPITIEEPPDPHEAFR